MPLKQRGQGCLWPLAAPLHSRLVRGVAHFRSHRGRPQAELEQNLRMLIHEQTLCFLTASHLRPFASMQGTHSDYWAGRWPSNIRSENNFKYAQKSNWSYYRCLWTKGHAFWSLLLLELGLAQLWEGAVWDRSSPSSLVFLSAMAGFEKHQIKYSRAQFWISKLLKQDSVKGPRKHVQGGIYQGDAEAGTSWDPRWEHPRVLFWFIPRNKCWSGLQNHHQKWKQRLHILQETREEDSLEF